MAGQNLGNMKIAILSTNDFEQVELTEPRKALEEAGAKTMVIAPSRARFKVFITMSRRTLSP